MFDNLWDFRVEFEAKAIFRFGVILKHSVDRHIPIIAELPKFCRDKRDGLCDCENLHADKHKKNILYRKLVDKHTQTFDLILDEGKSEKTAAATTKLIILRLASYVKRAPT